MKFVVFIFSLASAVSFADTPAKLVLDPGASGTVASGIETFVSCKKQPIADLGFDAIVYAKTDYFTVRGSDGDCTDEKYSQIPISETSVQTRIFRRFTCGGQKYLLIGFGRIASYIVRAADVFDVPAAS